MATQSNTSGSPAGSLQDRVAIVTGSSRGIGKAIAIHLASLGAKVVVNYASSAASAEEVVSHINSSYPCSSGPRAIAVKADVSEPDQVKALFDAAEEAFKVETHILVANAGIIDSKQPKIATTPVEDFDKIFKINTRGTFLCCREAAGRLKKGGGGRIITFSSSLATLLIPGHGAYSSAKAAVEAMTKVLCKELRGTGITANCIAPGPIATELFFEGMSEEHIAAAAAFAPLGRLGETKDVAPLVGFLAGDCGEWVNGQLIRVNGGFI